MFGRNEVKTCAVDVGFGRVKALSEARRLEYPSVVRTFRPVRYATGIARLTR